MDDVMKPPPMVETRPPFIPPGERRIDARSLLGLAKLLAAAGIVVVPGAGGGGGGGGGSGGGGGAVLTDTATITWDFSTPGEAKANVVLSAVGAFTPTRIAPGVTFTVPVDTQVLIALPIDVEGSLVVDGSLVMVD